MLTNPWTSTPAADDSQPTSRPSLLPITSATCEEETKKGFWGRLKQGLYPMPAPLRLSEQRQAAKPKTPDPKTGPLVRKAFELYSTGRYNLSSLNQELYRLGLARHGKPIGRNRLSEILNNPFHMGLIRH